jgi:hypothetical protein
MRGWCDNRIAERLGEAIESWAVRQFRCEEWEYPKAKYP